MLDSGDNCNQGCQWCPSSSTCEAQLPQNISCPNPVIVHIKSSDDDDGITTVTLEGCHLALMSGAVTSIVFIFLIAAAFALLSFCCWHKARNRVRASVLGLEHTYTEHCSAANSEPVCVPSTHSLHSLPPLVSFLTASQA